MTEFRYNNNAITNQKKFKPTANGNAADTLDFFNKKLRILSRTLVA